MMPAIKHMDMLMGFDTHIVLVPTPAGPVPTPIPHPYVGMIMEPMDYAPVVGATVFINGLPRATAGTAGQALTPHFPMGGAFAIPPSNESEMFMGSATVITEGEPQSFATCPVLSCQDIGLPAPPRAKKKSVPRSLMLPVTQVMPIPSGPLVLIGGPPTISMMGLAMSAFAKVLGKGIKAVKSTKRFKDGVEALSKRVHNRVGGVLEKLGFGKDSPVRNLAHRGICAVTGHPVDIATGKLFTDFVDLTLGGPFPFALERVWYSTSTYHGPFGHGFHASFDVALVETKAWAGLRLADGRVCIFPRLAVGDSSFDTAEKATLARDPEGYTFTTADGLIYRFTRIAEREEHVLSSIRDRNRFVVRFAYGTRGSLRAIMDSSGRIWDLEHDGSGHVVRIVGPHPSDAERRTVYMHYTYDERGNLVEARDALGHRERFRYEGHLLVQETKKSGLRFYFHYDGKDAFARCTRTWGDGGIYDHKLHYERDRTVVETSLGHKTTYEHDGTMVTKTIDPLGHTTRTTYDAGFRVVEEVNALGKATANTYDARGNLVQTMAPDGATLKFEYGPRDLPVKALDALGGAWQWERDELGRVIARTDPLGQRTHYAYNGPWLVSVTDAAGGQTRLGYDSAGNLSALVTPDGTTTRLEHDPLGRVVRMQGPKGDVQLRTLDVLGRPLQVLEADGNVRKFAYDAEGNVTHAVDQHHDVAFTYQGMNRLASRSEAGTRVGFQYDTEEQLTGIVNEHGLVYRFVMGPTGEVQEEHGFDGLLRRYQRDAAGRVVRVERPDDRFSVYTYDAAGRVENVTHWDESFEHYGYRMDGALTLAENQHTTLFFERDALGRVRKERRDGHWVESVYGADGLRAEVRSSMGHAQRITRNVMGDVTSVSAGSFEAGFVRDQLGLELERSLPGGLKSAWDRDHVGRPMAHRITSAQKSLRDVSYTWEPNDRLLRVVDALKGATDFRHDALGNLAMARYPSGELDLRLPDAVGNLFRREDRQDRQYGPAGQLLAQGTPQGTIHYRYDPEGNLLEKREPSGRVWHYAWEASGMLAKVTRPDGTEVTFAYDALGRRIHKTYRGQTTHWVWDGNTPLHEWVEGKLQQPEPQGPPMVFGDDPRTKKREAELEALLAQGPPARGERSAPITWLFEPESFAPMAKLCGEQQHPILTDHLGTPVLMADANGAVFWRAEISAYGELRDQEGERHACPFRWPGQYEDAETGLYYNRFRYYDPEAGQYASQDPIGLAGGPALYAYVHDPLAWVDPLGLAACGTSRRDALKKAKDSLGIPHSQQPTKQWTIHDPKRVKGPGQRHPDVRHQGKIMEYEVATAGGGTKKVYIVDHNHDPFHGGKGHFHTAQAKPHSGGTLNPGDRYQETGHYIAYD